MSPDEKSVSRQTVLLATLALIGFAGNSLLCRLALAGGAVDPATFTGVRLISGALILSLIALVRGRGRRPSAISGSWTSSLALLLYAAPFSFAYLRLGAGLGALILFAAVQTTMISWLIWRGGRPRIGVWVGLMVAMTGLIVLTLPGATAPDLFGVGLMLVAGAAWGAYSLRGRAAGTDPLAETAGNFLRSVPLVGLLVAASFLFEEISLSPRGLALALASGALASGIGYSLWYAALPGLTSDRAAIVQLLVPAVTALAATVVLDEPLSARLLIGGAVILGGVAIALLSRN